MPKVLILFVAMAFLGNSCTGNAQVSDSKPVSHDQWDALLGQYVTSDGNVDYKGFKAAADQLEAYLDLLSDNHPNTENWTEDQRMAYWINAYNAFTVKLVVDHYPVESIKDIKKGIPMINSVWDIKFIEIEGQTYDLNNIEHSILRKEFDEPRIHFAINCASVSCPVLRPEAYTADKLEEQLQDQTSIFLGDSSKNIVTQDELKLSKIFSWFKGDFTKDGSLAEFIATHSGIDVSDKADISFLNYDWNLNE